MFLRNNAATVLSPETQLGRSQWSAFLRALTIFSGARWVNHPQATYLAESKPYQLSIASELGFSVPATLVTNDFMEIERCSLGDPFILKSLDTVLLSEGEENIFSYSSVLSIADARTANLATAPVTAQRLLQPKLDLRVTVVGGFAQCARVVEDGCGIDGDWRLRPRETVSFEPHQLDQTVMTRCIALTRRLGLAYAAIDLAETSSGIYFIEANPTGEWGWLNSAENDLEGKICNILTMD